MRRAAFFAAFACSWAASTFASVPDARANGRFPESNQIFFSKEDPNLVLLRVTFGLVVSHDRGKTWRWVCEKSIGSAGVEDPMWATTPSGALLATTDNGLAMSRDQACTFAFAGGALAGLVFADLAQNPADRKDVVAFASAYDKQDDAGNILFASQLFETTDEGTSFTALAGTIDPMAVGYTVDLAASDPKRMYLTATLSPSLTPKALFYASVDHGATFASTSIDFAGNERAIYIAAVDPLSADRVYVRTFAASDQPSRVLLTEDGGKTFKTIFTSTGAISGFALSPDGKKIYVGGPLDGVQVASTTDYVFTKKSKLAAQCLVLADDGLWACSNEAAGFVAGLSTDDGATFQPKLHFCDIGGPLDCPAGSSTNAQCPKLWPAQQATLGCSAPSDGGPSGDAGADASADAEVFTNPPSKSCACGVAPASPLAAITALGGAAGVALGLFGRRRRRR